MLVNCSHTEIVPLNDLVPHTKNNNRHTEEQLKLLAKIMKHQGWRNPVVVSKLSGQIVAGHARAQAARQLGWTHAPVDYQEFQSEADEYAHLTADNEIARLAKTDLSQVLKDVLELGPDFDLDLLGIPDFKLPEDFEPQCDEDEIPEQFEAKTKPGDIYQIGRHRLMCGDSTSIDAVEKLMAGEKADVVYTDPPYGMNLDTDYAKMGKNWISDMTGQHSQKKYEKLIGDDKEFDPGIVLGYFEYVKEVFLWGADHYYWNLPKDGSWLIWDKRRSDNFAVKETVDNIFGSHFEVCWSKQKHRWEIFRHYRVFGATEGIGGEAPSGKNNTHHPTQKPIILNEKILDKIQGNLIVDLFGGSGSTLIACEKTNRKCFMMELDPHYCDVIIARWEKYTGKQAELING